MKQTVTFLMKLLITGSYFLFLGMPVTDAQTITSFSPGCGSAGTLVTITGTGLGNLASCTIGGKPAIVVSNTGTTLTGMVMPGAVTGPVSVTTTGGAATSQDNFTVTPTPYPSIQQGSRLTGSHVYHNQFGHCVSLSADGNTAIMAGDAGIYPGTFWIFIRSGSTWTEQYTQIVGTNDPQPFSDVGVTVHLSADGNTAIVGGLYELNYTGAAWIFYRNGNTWTPQSGALMGADTVGQPGQGSSVALSADGNTAIVGGPGDNYGIGAAWIYTRTGNTWTQAGNKLVGSGAVGPAGQGCSVSMSADGNTAIVGGPFDNAGIGAAWIYTRTGNTWTQQGSKLTGTGAIGKAEQGFSVSLGADGNTAMVGGPCDNGYIGAAWIYTRTGNSWTQQGSKLTGTGAIGEANQGFSVSLSADGNRAILGGWNDNNIHTGWASAKGASWIFTRNGNTWTQQGDKLIGSDASSGAYQGWSVSMSANGSTALVGGCGEDDLIGAAWVYVASNTYSTSVSITAVPAGAVCSGTSVTFTAAPVSEGSPAYQWMNKGLAIAGATSVTYTSNTLRDGDEISVHMTSSVCGMTGILAVSNAITMVVNSSEPAGISITASTNPACAGSAVTLTAAATNAGTTPSYKWKVNGLSVGSNSETYSYLPLNNDEVTCELTSGSVCATGSPAKSNTVTMEVIPVLPVSILITANTNTVCSGSRVNFAALGTNGGSAPAYQWYVNGKKAGTNSASYSCIPVNSDKVSCMLTSDLVCATGNPAGSNTIAMSILPSPVSAFTYKEDTLGTFPGKLLFINGSLGAIEYYWDFGNGTTATEKNPTVQYEEDRAYTIRLMVTNAPGCTDTSSANYILLTPNLFIPNAFSPADQDPNVRVFKPSGRNLQKYRLEIYNRWNNLVWSTTQLTERGEPAEGWDGNINGDPAPPGVYLWKVSGRFTNGEIHGNRTKGKFPKVIQGNFGTVTLIR